MLPDKEPSGESTQGRLEQETPINGSRAISVDDIGGNADDGRSEEVPSGLKHQHGGQSVPTASSIPSGSSYRVGLVGRFWDVGR